MHTSSANDTTALFLTKYKIASGSFSFDNCSSSTAGEIEAEDEGSRDDTLRADRYAWKGRWIDKMEN